MDPLHLCIAFGPLAIYLTFLSLLNLGRRPQVVSGFRDTACLALGVSGLIIVGPMELLLPERAAFHFGPYIWLLLLVLYGLAVALFLLSMRPRLVVYNATSEELRPVLSEIVQQLDAQSRWAGEGLSLPQLGVQLYLDRHPLMRNVQLVAAGPGQDIRGWVTLEKKLREALRQRVTRRGRQGYALLLTASLLMALVASLLIHERSGMLIAIRELMRM